MDEEIKEIQDVCEDLDELESKLSLYLYSAQEVFSNLIADADPARMSLVAQHSDTLKRTFAEMMPLLGSMKVQKVVDNFEGDIDSEIQRLEEETKGAYERLRNIYNEARMIILSVSPFHHQFLNISSQMERDESPFH